MNSNLVITFEGEYVQVLSSGVKTYEFALALWLGVVKTCQKHDCFNVLGIANTTKPVEILEAYEHGRLFMELGISPKYRIAWVEQNPQASGIAFFIETVLYNRGIHAHLFPDVAKARQWLLNENGV